MVQQQEEGDRDILHRQVHCMHVLPSNDVGIPVTGLPSVMLEGGGLS